MELVGFEVNALQLFIADCAPGGVFAPIKPVGDFQSLCRGRSGDEMDGTWFRSPATARRANSMR